jgi:cation diffusion facilitator CzcD-associated flavoprotein CzcO
LSDRCKSAGHANGLAELEARAAHDLEILDYPSGEWLPRATHASGVPIRDVAVCGAGQGGLATAFLLAREGVRNVLIIDQAVAGREGPWATFARMRTLRTPKYLSGPEMGIASLSYRAWHEAQPDKMPWGSLDRITTRDWMGYLVWFRRMSGVAVQNETRLIAVSGEPDGLLLIDVARHGVPDRLFARKLVLATGMDGGGRWTEPPALSGHLPRHLWRSSADAIDFAVLRGRRVGILGFGASAVDNAAAALEAGAASAEVFARKSIFAEFGEARGWLETSGFLRHFADLDDARKWRLMLRYHAKGSPAPRWSLERARLHAGFRTHLGAPWLTTRSDGSTVTVLTPVGQHTFDFVIFATGVAIDLSLRDELAGIAPLAATWADRYTPPPGEENDDIARHPYLGRGFELCERRHGSAPWLANIHLFNWGASTSVGINAASISGMKFGVSRLVNALTRDLYFTIADQHADRLPRFDTDDWE